MKQEKINKALKRVCIALIRVFVLTAVFASIGDDDTVAPEISNKIEEEVAISEEVIAEVESKADDNNVVEATPHVVVGKDFSEVSTLKPRTVRNDTTGNWRVTTIAANIEMQEYAVDYYNRYFEGNGLGEFHYIVNFTTNTTTKITNLGSFLEVVVLQYVKGEEHDAKELGGGNLLAQYFVDKETAEVEIIQ